MEPFAIRGSVARKSASLHPMSALVIVKRLLRYVVRRAAHVPVVGAFVLRYYERKPLEPAWRRLHPFDREHGTDTSGFVPGNLLVRGSTGYGAAQPSIIRSALEAIPERDGVHFLDLGCGKGRPLMVAAEAGFSKVTGVEFTPALARIARRNARIFARSQPRRARIAIVTGDAVTYPLPLGPLVVFLYNPFARIQTEQLLRHIEASLERAPRDLYVVSYNPTWGDVFDGSRALERRYAAHLPYDAREIGFGPNDSDSVVIWQNRGNRHPRPPGTPDASITIVTPGNRAVISEDGRVR